MPRDAGDFIKDLRSEIVAAQGTRYKYTQQKFAFVLGLLGIGSAFMENPKFVYLIYLAPLVALLFDLYVLGENFGIRRIGVFIKRCKTAPKEERFWQYVVSRNRDIFASLAGPISSLAVLAISVLYLFPLEKTQGRFKVWLLINLVIFLLWCAKGYWLKKRLGKFERDLETSKANFQNEIVAKDPCGSWPSNQ